MNQTIVITIDDFHNFCTKKRVTSTDLNQAVHMASAIVDALGLPAVALPAADQIHRTVDVSVAGERKRVRGCMSAVVLTSIFQEEVRQFYTKTLLKSLPVDYQDLDVSNMQRSIINLRYIKL